jgi:hypothetical protein
MNNANTFTVFQKNLDLDSADYCEISEALTMLAMADKAEAEQPENDDLVREMIVRGKLVAVGEIAADDLEQVYGRGQHSFYESEQGPLVEDNKNWTEREGAKCLKIMQSKHGLRPAACSVSMGDIVIGNGCIHIVASYGFHTLNA